MGRRMNKTQYLGILEYELSNIPFSERNELLYEYEAHFIFGLQNGKTEEEISAELGNPYEIVKEMLQDRNDLQTNSYRQTPPPPYYDAHAHNYKEPSSSLARTIFLSIALGFLTLVIVFPLGVSIWSVWLAFSVSSVAFIISPVLALVDYVLYGDFVPAKWYAAIGLVGVGLIFALAIKPFFNFMLKATVGYFNWMRLIVKGSYNE
jgi:uncharacterized membrane protein